MALAVALAGCNFVLGIHEPEEITPNVRYYPWDGASFDESDGSEPDGANASADGPTGTADAAETGPTCSNPPLPDGGVCGAGCASLCPLGRVCFKDGDCASGRCFGGRCTLPTCTNGVRDGQETDNDCGGLCATCGTGRACRLGSDCTSRICTNGVCLAPLVDASVDARSDQDASAGPDGPLPTDAKVTPDADAPSDSNIVDAEASRDSDVVTDAADAGISCEAGCSPDGG